MCDAAHVLEFDFHHVQFLYASTSSKCAYIMPSDSCAIFSTWRLLYFNLSSRGLCSKLSVRAVLLVSGQARVLCKMTSQIRHTSTMMIFAQPIRFEN